jgi:hypothetical protein
VLTSVGLQKFHLADKNATFGFVGDSKQRLFFDLKNSL